MGKRYLVDTNVFRKYLNDELSNEGYDLLNKIFEVGGLQISVITRIELLSIPTSNIQALSEAKQFVEESLEFGLSEEIIEKTIQLRQNHKIRLPDAIIAATALCNDFILLSDNDSDFGKIPHLRYVNPRKL